MNGELGYGWADNYDMSVTRQWNGDVSVSMANGASLSFQPNTAGGFNPPKGSADTLTNGNSITPGSGYTLTVPSARTRYGFTAEGQFSPQGHLITESDLDGNTTQLIYQGQLLAEVIAPGQRELRFGYSGSRLTSVTDPLGRTISFAYNGAGDLASATDAARRTWSFGYGGGNRLQALTDPDGGLTTVTYDGHGRVDALADPAGGRTTWSYAGNPAAVSGGVTTVTDPAGNLATFTYASGQLRSAVLGAEAPEAATTSYTYNPATGDVATITDADGHTTKYAYDGQGNLARVTDAGPSPEQTSFTYNSLHEVATQTVAPGETTSYRYDPDGNLLSVTDPDKDTTCL